jgi:cytochrome c oxidase assembly protein subunit 20
MSEDSRKAGESRPEDAQDSETRPKRRSKYDYPQTQAGKMWEAFGNPKDPVNQLPGGTYNTAGGKPPSPSIWDAFSFEMFQREGRPKFYQTSCARDSLMVGIASGGAVGGLRFILKGS